MMGWVEQRFRIVVVVLFVVVATFIGRGVMSVWLRDLDGVVLSDVAIDRVEV